MSSLRESWRDACVGVDNDAAVARWYDWLTREYSAPTRYYHTLHHVGTMLEWVKRAKPSADDSRSVLLATWFHDCVYDSTAKDSEERSAAQFDAFALEAALPADLVAKVRDWILQTKHHMECPRDAPYDKRLFLDIDLSILGAEPDVYACYARQIRQEYAHVEHTRYCNGRASVLATFLRADTLYFTPNMRELLEDNARRNIAAEMAVLQTGNTM